MIRNYSLAVAIICLMTFCAPSVMAQSYSAPAVTVSKDKVRMDGKVYYSHVVQERQTLYSISKAYGVTIDEIYAANKDLNLESEGLKKDQIILIPVKNGASPAEEAKSAAAVQKISESTASQQSGSTGADDYYFYKVKWYEDLDLISAKCKVSKQAIMNINGMDSDKLVKKQTIKIPYHPEAWENKKAVTEDTKKAETVDEKTVTPSVPETKVPEIQKAIPSNDISISFLLPFNAKGKADQQIMDFYCGALLAAKHIGQEGIKLTINTYDTAGGSIPITKENCENSDFIIGPVSSTDIAKASRICGKDVWIVSPLDQKVESIADTSANIIQAPSPAKKQIEDMVNWIKADMEPGDKLVVITQKGAAASSYNTMVMKAIKASGIQYSVLSSSVQDGRNMATSISNVLTASGKNRIVLDSDNKPFAMEVFRNLYTISSQKKDIILYGTSKTKSFEGSEGVDVQHMHAVDSHFSTSYYVDYTAKDVKSFLYEYRALYNAEPSASAFQGYDLLRYFTTLAHKYGRGWQRMIDDTELKGLQSILQLEKIPKGGYVNAGVRRIIYAPDYTVKAVR